MEPEQKSNGALVGSIIIIIILIVGGIYLWKTGLKDKALPVTPGLSDGMVEEDLTVDEANNIDAELDELDLEGLDEGLE